MTSTSVGSDLTLQVPNGAPLVAPLARTTDEQLQQRRRCLLELAAVRGGAPGDPPDDRRTAVGGVLAAADWTLGRVERAPISRVPREVTVPVIATELAYAMDAVTRRQADWPSAVGAYVWLRWLTGAEDDIVYPLW